MPSDNQNDDTAIIYGAYAERVREAFRVFAENLAMGEAARGSRERFARAVEQIRKARDIALDVVRGVPDAAASEPAREAEAIGDGLSDEERKLIEQALAGTTGQRAPDPLPSANARSPLMRR